LRWASPRTNRICKACNKADAVMLYCFAHSAEIWWKGIETKLTRPGQTAGLAHPHAGIASPGPAGRNAACSCKRPSRKERLTLGDDKTTVDIEPIRTEIILHPVK